MVISSIKEMMIYYLQWLVATTVFTSSFAAANENSTLTAYCPKICSCLGNVVDCSKRSLKAVPPAIPHWVETL